MRVFRRCRPVGTHPRRYARWRGLRCTYPRDAHPKYNAGCTLLALLCHVDDEKGWQSAYHTHSVYRSLGPAPYPPTSWEQAADDVVDFIAFQKFIVLAEVRPPARMPGRRCSMVH
jgi:hypothetical protein